MAEYRSWFLGVGSSFSFPTRHDDTEAYKQVTLTKLQDSNISLILKIQILALMYTIYIKCTLSVFFVPHVSTILAKNIYLSYIDFMI